MPDKITRRQKRGEKKGKNPFSRIPRSNERINTLSLLLGETPKKIRNKTRAPKHQTVREEAQVCGPKSETPRPKQLIRKPPVIGHVLQAATAATATAAQLRLTDEKGKAKRAEPQNKKKTFQTAVTPSGGSSRVHTRGEPRV